MSFKSVSEDSEWHNDGSRMDAGRLFHTRGLSTAKDRSPNVILVGRTSRGAALFERDVYLWPFNDDNKQ